MFLCGIYFIYAMLDFMCVIWLFDEMGLGEQVILSYKGNRGIEQSGSCDSDFRKKNFKNRNCGFKCIKQYNV